MPNNMTSGPNFVVAKEDKDLSSTSEITALNTVIIINEQFESFKPGRISNGLMELVAGEGYYFYMLQAAEFPFIIPPIDDAGTPSTTFDTDAQAYFTRVASAGATLTTTEKNAYNSFVLAAKSHGYYSKFKALYMYWGNAAAAKLNTVNTTFPQVWTGGMAYGRFATHGDGTSGYASLGLTPSTHLTANNYSFGTDVVLNSNQVVNEMGVYVDANSGLTLTANDAGTTSVRANSNATSLAITGQTNSQGLYIITRTANNSMKLLKNTAGVAGVSTLGTNTTNEAGTLPNIPIHIWATNFEGVGAAAFNAQSHRIDFFADGLSDAEAANFANDYRSFLTAAG